MVIDKEPKPSMTKPEPKKTLLGDFSGFGSILASIETQVKK
jgi:hypothetical protein